MKEFLDKTKVLWGVIQDFIDVRGGTVLSMWSLGMLASSIYSVVKTGHVDAPIAAMYSTVVAAFAGTNIAKALGGSNDKS